MKSVIRGLQRGAARSGPCAADRGTHGRQRTCQQARASMIPTRRLVMTVLSSWSDDRRWLQRDAGEMWGRTASRPERRLGDCYALVAQSAAAPRPNSTAHASIATAFRSEL